MDWTAHYEKIESMNGRHPYACSYSYCSHRARIAWGMLFHELFGAHHGGHRRHTRRAKPKNR